MAHFAQLDENDVVVNVIVVNNSDILDENGNESESKGVEFCKSLLGGNSWVQTSYSGSFRAHFAGIGYKYDRERDAFLEIKQYPSWVLDLPTLTWVPPIPVPDAGFWEWNELNEEWVESKGD
jgi:hypothetical protein